VVGGKIHLLVPYLKGKVAIFTFYRGSCSSQKGDVLGMIGMWASYSISMTTKSHRMKNIPHL